jgi:hypothetical protein
VGAVAAVGAVAVVLLVAAVLTAAFAAAWDATALGAGAVV